MVWNSINVNFNNINVDFYDFLEKCDESGLKMIEKCDFGLILVNFLIIFYDFLWFFDKL